MTNLVTYFLNPKNTRSQKYVGRKLWQVLREQGEIMATVVEEIGNLLELTKA